MSRSIVPPAGAPTSSDQPTFPTILVGGPLHEHPVIYLSERLLLAGVTFQSFPEGAYRPFLRWRLETGEFRWSMRWHGPPTPRANDQQLTHRRFM